MNKKLATALAGAILLLLAMGASPAAAIDFEILEFDGGTFNASHEAQTQAGSAPTTGETQFLLNSIPNPLVPGFFDIPVGTLDNTLTEVPSGVVGNPQALPACSGSLAECPDDTQVGYAVLRSPAGALSGGYYPVYNMRPPKGVAALFKFTAFGAPVLVEGRVRTGSDYGVSFETLHAPQTLGVYGVKFVFWGVPADASHDQERGSQLPLGTCADPAVSFKCAPRPSDAPLVPFLRLPTSCVGPVPTNLTVTTWEGYEDRETFMSHDGPNEVGVSGCNGIDFSPTLEARPTTNLADSPSGLDVDLHIPQNESCDPGPPANCGTAEAHLKDTTVVLPSGVTLNPSAANGLGACDSQQFGLTSAVGVDPITTTAAPVTCPDNSKIGTLEVDTPLLDHPVEGSVYIAKPYDNPFGSLLAIYLGIHDPESGVVVKLAGKVISDSSTGQLVTTFANSPQLPFEDFVLHFKGGAHGTLRTPGQCGTYETMSSLTPWSAPDSGPPDTPSDSWAITQSPTGGSCPGSDAQRPNAPIFDGGSTSPIAGAHVPTVINLRREDGSQEFSSLTVTPPPGLVGKLAGIPYCPESALDAAAAKTGREEQGSPSCPDASYVGSVAAAAGAGPAPYYAPGKAYLTGPYKGAPLSLAIVTPAVAGPFDLGTIVVRTALFVNRTTAQITAVSDPIPHILQGIPLDVRSIQVKLDRSDFTMNPTSCDPSTFGGTLLSTSGVMAALQSRFQVGECGRLGFKPSLSLNLKGGIKRNGYPALTAVLEPRAGDANLSSISVALPHSEFLAQNHIRTVCTRVQFAANECPEAAIYGQATVYTPLLDYPLTGPVYLRSSDNLLPDLVPDLRGPANQPIMLEADGRTDSHKGGIRNTFDFIPDAPFTKLVLQMQGGQKGLLVNSTNICAKHYRATVKYGAHNGASLEGHPVLRAQCPKKKSQRHRGAHRRHRGG